MLVREEESEDEVSVVRAKSSVRLDPAAGSGGRSLARFALDVPRRDLLPAKQFNQAVN